MKEEVKKLIEEIHRYNYYFYILSKPLVSDVFYDERLALLEKLKNKENQESLENGVIAFTETFTEIGVGSDLDVNSGFEKVKHSEKMLSITNSYSFDSLQEFNNRLEKELAEELIVNKEGKIESIEYCCELKYDGLAMSIIYNEKGELESALTRGDGETGENVINNIKEIKSVPKDLTLREINQIKGEKITIRGEIVMPHSEFHRLNSLRIECGEEPFANPRNAASGSLKLKNSLEVKKRGLLFIPYAIVSGIKVNSQYDSFAVLKRLGFDFIESQEKTLGMEKAVAFIEKWDKKRESLPFDTDGVVVKVNAKEWQKKVGNTAKSPKWVTAFKYKTETQFTRLLSVDYQVGRTGAVTPVANLEPVEIGGSIVRRASLHNKEQMTLLDLHLNDIVFVEKGGEIIPKITGVKEHSLENEKVVFVEKCPSCNGGLTQMGEEAKYYCTNTVCGGQLLRKIEHFVSRKAFDIDGLGGETIAKLVETKMVERLEDLFSLDRKFLLSLELFREKSADNLLSSLKNSIEKTSYPKMLFGLGIRFVGENVSKILAKEYSSVDLLAKATKEELLQVREVGDRIAESVVEFFKNDANLKTIERLKEIGFSFENKKRDKEIEEVENKSKLLEGKKFLVTGVFEGYSRDELKNMVEEYGGESVTSLSKKTDYLIVGEKAGGSKLDKAKVLDVKCVSLTEFFSLINK